MEARGLINHYACQKCRKPTRTINLTTGTTPFGITCPNCSSTECFSNFYRQQLDIKMPITHAWFRPTKKYLELGLGKEWNEHVWLGGLVLTRLEELKEMISEEPPAVFDKFLGWISKIYDIPGDEFEKMLRYRGITYANAGNIPSSDHSNG